MLDNYRIKEITTADLKEGIDLVWNVFLEFEAPEYSEEGIKEFKEFITYGHMKQKLETKELLLWGCYDKNKVVGVIAVKKLPHISLLFVDKNYHRKGIARTLFNKALDYYKQNKINIANMTVNSSPYAKEAYEKLGFIQLRQEQVLNGIRFIPMKYKETR